MDSELKYDFMDELDACIEKALELKSQEPKSEETRYWAVVYTDLEKVKGYVGFYLLKGDS